MVSHTRDTASIRSSTRLVYPPLPPPPTATHRHPSPLPPPPTATPPSSRSLDRARTVAEMDKRIDEATSALAVLRGQEAAALEGVEEAKGACAG